MVRVWSDLRSYGDLLSVCGALVIFFSWLVTNAAEARFKAAAAAADDLSDKLRLFQTLRELKESVESSAAETLNVNITLGRAVREIGRSLADAPRVATFEEHNTQLLGLSARRLNAKQIDNGIALCSLVLEMATDDDSDHVLDLREIRAEMTLFNAAKDLIFQEAEAALRAGEDPSSALQGLDEQIEPYPQLLFRAVDLSNAISAERAADVLRLRQYAKWSRQTAFVLYGLGTVLVIGGTALNRLL